MKRKLLQQLATWKASTTRKPLIVSGARQTGKTYTISQFGRAAYEDLAVFNLEKSPEAARVFEGSIDPHTIIELLSSLHGQPIIPGKTLVFLDEVQAAERALTSLKYFCEDAPEHHVIAAGSLLGIAVSRKKISYPVGKVDMLNLYPLDFEEFLWAQGEELFVDAIREAYEWDAPFALHKKGLSEYRRYLFTGGMPEAVKLYRDTKDTTAVRAVQDTIMTSYIADITKYAEASETVRILEAYESIPAQLHKENHKFQYSVIKSGGRASIYLYPLAWLDAARVTIRCKQVSEGLIPLVAFENPESFKLYLSDVGLLSARYALSYANIAQDGISSTLFKGALAESFVAQHLDTYQLKPCYWGQAGRAEVDFVVLDREGRVVPIEVKSGDNVRSRSLNLFREAYGCECALRFSAKNFGKACGIRSLPLYAAFCLEGL